MSRRNIDLFIVGVQKGSTSSLIHYLSQHPELQTGMNTEFTFFLNDNFTSEGFEKAYDRFLGGFETSEKKVAFKNVGVINSDDALRRLAHYYPNVKIILLLRNPVERMYSSFLHARRRGWENIDDFDTAITKTNRVFPTEIAMRNCQYVEASRYSKKVKTIKSLFPDNHVSIDISEEFNLNPDTYLKKYLALLKVKNVNFEFDLTKRFQVKKEPKNILLSRFINNFLFQKLNFLRPIIPYQFSAKIKKQLKNLSEKEIQSTEKPDLSKYWYLFDDDIKELERLLDRNLDVWRR